MIERCLGQHCCKTWHRLGQRWVTVTVIAFLVSGSTQPVSSTPLSQSVGHFAWTVSSISVVGDSNVHISILDQTESQKTKKRNLVFIYTLIAVILASFSISYGIVHMSRVRSPSLRTWHDVGIQNPRRLRPPLCVLTIELIPSQVDFAYSSVYLWVCRHYSFLLIMNIMRTHHT